MDLDLGYVNSKLEHIALKYLGVSLDEFSNIDYSKLNWYGKIIVDVINNYIIDSKNLEAFNNLNNVSVDNLTISEYISLLKSAIFKFNKDLAKYLRIHEEEILCLINAKIILKIDGINTSIQSNYDRIDALENISNNNLKHLSLKDDIDKCNKEIDSLRETRNQLTNMYQDIAHINEMFDNNLKRKK